MFCLILDLNIQACLQKSSELNSVWDADSLTKVHVRQKDRAEEYSLQIALEASKKAVLQGSMDVLLVI
jgi:hypothetical protein